jgi:putative transposase
MIATLVRSIFEQPDRDTTWSQLADVTDKLTQAGFCDVVTYLLDAADDILAFSAFPVEHWPKIRSNNPKNAQQGDPPAHRRGRDLPQPSRRHPARRRPLGRADRRVGHHQALHERRVTQDAKVLDPSPEDPRPAIDAAGKEADTDSAT